MGGRESPESGRKRSRAANEEERESLTEAERSQSLILSDIRLRVLRGSVRDWRIFGQMSVSDYYYI